MSSEKDCCLQLTFRQPVLQGRQIENVRMRHLLTEKDHWNFKIIACMTGALGAKRGERDISRGARDEGKRKKYFIFSLRLVSRFALISRSPRLAHKAPVMQAIKIIECNAFIQWQVSEFCLID